jgi:UDP-glucose 4-epimerase
LQKIDYEIFVIDNLSFGNREFITLDDAHFINEDILNRDSIFKHIKDIQPEIVVHLAAIHFIPYCNQHPFTSANINIMGTKNILDAIVKNVCVKKVLFASTAAVYPIVGEAINEETNVEPSDIYGLSKVVGERLCHEFFASTKVQTIICRFFNAFGPNETNPHLFPEIENQIKKGERTIKLGNLTPKRDFIHTYDMARAVEALLNVSNNTIDTFNLGRGIEYSVKEIADAFESALGEQITIEIDKTRVRKVDRKHLLADISKIKKHTNWVPEWSIEQGIKDLLGK